MGCRQTTIKPRLPFGSTSNCNHGGTVVTSTDSSRVWVTCRQRQLIRSTWPRLVVHESDFERIGAEVFERIFSRHPDLIRLFTFGAALRDADVESVTSDDAGINDGSNEELEEYRQRRIGSGDGKTKDRMKVIREHPAFRRHAAAFVSAIGMAVETLDDWDGQLTGTLVQFSLKTRSRDSRSFFWAGTLVQLGATHSTTQGFTVNNFEAFAESLLHVWQSHLADCICGLDASLNDVIHAWEVLFIFMMMKLRDGYQMAREQDECMGTYYSNDDI